ncbi:Crp/Fnr family transcriptional regulator [Rhizobium sp. RM]|uniref:Crp/Fnr family transcriptional regulator n=1 Tax=Rhizobium sp. RM TaxID=2748079 RepID=UPI00110D7C9C|nr:Crp/Fnr family transcriptional regulator [Rhizobium sp. RM]NWJ27559.1 Crp/Fnr family transcriptional regulator [Rhizobium sp. RM]TMV19983.1 Crp/Fnr family transcriptional regulator [Rhizobium sp. Td3]
MQETIGPLLEKQSNLLLDLLDDDVMNEVLSLCSPVELSLGDKLICAGSPIERVYFLQSGIASIVVVSETGRETEAGIVGKEGFVPIGALAGVETSMTEIIVQAPGKANAIDIEDFRSLIAKNRFFLEIMIAALHASRAQVECTASSNAVHTVTQRLARWLLMCQDRVEGNHLQLTHDFLSKMLAVRRASVTDALHILESEGWIRSERARIVIKNRAGLQAYARDLYGLAEAESARVFMRFRKDDVSSYETKPSTEKIA